MKKVYIGGIGSTTYGKLLDKSLDELSYLPVIEAIQDLGIEPKEIDVAYYGNVYAGKLQGHYSSTGQRFLKQVGINGIPITRVENACASGASAIQMAWLAVASGHVDVALAFGSEKMIVGSESPLARSLDSFEGRSGWVVPGEFGIRANSYLDKYKIDEKNLALIAHKNLSNAKYNPLVQRKRNVSVEDILSSEMLCEPLTKLQSSSKTDGGSAVILISEKFKNKRSIEISAVSQTSGTYLNDRDITFNDLEYRAAKKAYSLAGIEAKDISLVEVHDCFSIAEILRVESLGLCEKGKYLNSLRDGLFSKNGTLPVNLSGGLIGKGHPLGATGVGQVVELVKQIRGEAASELQVQNIDYAMAHCSGGSLYGDTATASVIILKGLVK